MHKDMYMIAKNKNTEGKNTKGKDPTIEYLSYSYISIGFSGRRPNFEVSFTLKPVKLS